MTPLYTNFPATIHTEFENLSQWAQTQEAIHIGSPGSIEQRQIGSNTYFYHRFYNANGKLSERYIGGPAGSSEGNLTHGNAQTQIEQANMVVQNVKMFRKLDFAILDDRAGATLAALHNHGLFAAGLTLIGSHAYGAILNTLGVKAPRYLTEDIDTVRSNPLHIATTPALNLLEILKTSGLPFIKAKTGLKPAENSETYKLPGNVKLLFDLLTSGSNLGKPVLIPELDAYAQSIPHLNFLIKDRMTAIAPSKNYVVPIYVPTPARFAVHKLFSAASRVNQPTKSDKDIVQAATIICAVEDRYPGDITDMFKAFPKSGRLILLKGSELALQLIQSHSEQCGNLVEQLIAELKQK